VQTAARQSASEPEFAAVFEPAFVPAEAPAPAARELSPEEELMAWKAERYRERFARIPWRQLSLMAGLCFGIAGFALPDSTNDALSWLLYALAAASFAAGILKRKAAIAA
jgi:hypothetical protein